MSNEEPQEEVTVDYFTKLMLDRIEKEYSDLLRPSIMMYPIAFYSHGLGRIIWL